MRTKGLLLLATLATVVPVWLSGVVAGAGAPGGVGGAAASHRSSTALSLAVLRTWDRARAAAWAAGDPRALARLYLPGSRAGARDVQDLRRWVGRGLRVSGLRQQVSSLRVVHRTGARVVVVVTERTVDGIAEGRGRRTAIPTSAWAAHRVTLRRYDGTWRVEEAQPAR
jgi:hypothetical protein